MTTSTQTSVRLSDRAKLWVTKALKADHAQTSEQVIWDVAVMVFPNPAATDSLVESSADPSALVPYPVLVIYLEIPGNDPETSIYISPIVAPFGLTAERVTHAVNSALKSMRAERDRLAKLPVEE